MILLKIFIGFLNIEKAGKYYMSTKFENLDIFIKLKLNSFK